MSNNFKIMATNRWSSVLINAILTLIIGIVLIFVPETIYATIIIAIGIMMIISGIGFITYTYMSKKATSKSKTILYSQAIINIIVGLFMIFQHEIVKDFIIYFIAIWLIITGGTQIFSAPAQKNIIPHTNIILINGVTALGLGVIILIWPEFPLIFIGYFTVFISIILFYYSFISFKHRKQTVNIEFENIEEAEIVEDIKN